MALSYVFGIGLSVLASRLIFGSTLPYYKMEIFTEKSWVETLERLFIQARKEIAFTTLAFSSIDIHKRVELALDKSLLRGVKLDIIAARERMPDTRYSKLVVKGCTVTLIPQEILDKDDRFWHHLMVIDSKHWLWINPHEPEKRDVHYGYYKMFDLDQAKEYREKLKWLKGFADLSKA